MGKHAEGTKSLTVQARLLFWTRVSSTLIKLSGKAEKRWRFALYEQTGVWTKTFDETLDKLEEQNVPGK
jgi:hypothetical protein